MRVFVTHNAEDREAYFGRALPELEAIAEVRLEKVALAMLPYLIALFLLLFVLIIAPDITMYLPRVLGFAS